MGYAFKAMDIWSMLHLTKILRCFLVAMSSNDKC